jgi:predicted nicotinamide N-methyase
MNPAITTQADRRRFILGHTALGHSALVPDIKLYLATEITPLWQATEMFLEENNIAPPFWAFAWPGSEALARYVTDQPQLVAGRRVLDFASGCGLAAIAAAKAGAAVEAAEIDPLACSAIALNADRNGCPVKLLEGDVVGQACRWDVILTGDVCYEAPMTRHILPWLRDCARTASVIIADPGRTYVPQKGAQALARMQVPTSLELEDATSRLVTLLRLAPAP